MRIAVAATAPFGAAVLAGLAARHEVAFLLTRPDAPAGRGRRLAQPPAAQVAERLGIPLQQPARPALPADAVDAVVVCAYGLLIPAQLLRRTLWLNVHPSLLPRWRGAAPVERAIMAGDEVTGVTIMGVTAGLDSGPVYLQEQEEIRPEDTYGTLAGRLEQLSGELLVRALDEPPEPVEQPEAGVTYADKILAEDRWLDPSRPADELDRRCRRISGRTCGSTTTRSSACSGPGPCPMCRDRSARSRCAIASRCWYAGTAAWRCSKSSRRGARR
jgi:methionyl-tRNA formyltransferase